MYLSISVVLNLATCTGCDVYLIPHARHQLNGRILIKWMANQLLWLNTEQVSCVVLVEVYCCSVLGEGDCEFAQLCTSFLVINPCEKMGLWQLASK